MCSQGKLGRHFHNRATLNTEYANTGKGRDLLNDTDNEDDTKGSMPKSVQHDIVGSYQSHVSIGVRGLSIVPDFSDELAFDPEFEVDHHWIEERIQKDNSDIFR